MLYQSNAAAHGQTGPRVRQAGGDGGAPAAYLLWMNYLLGEFHSSLPANGVVEHRTRELQWAWPKIKPKAGSKLRRSDHEMLERSLNFSLLGN